MIQRRGEVVITMLVNVQQATNKPLIRATIVPGSLIYTTDIDSLTLGRSRAKSVNDWGVIAMTNYYLKRVNLLLEIDIPKQGFPGFQQAQYFLNEAADTLRETTEKAQETLQITENISSKTSDAIQTAIASSSSQWLQDHQAVLHLVQLLIWATDHPIVSIITLIFALTVAWIFIKAIGRLIETVTLSLLQAPLKLSQTLLGVSAKSLSNFGGLVVKQFVGAKNTESLTLQDSISQPIHQNKHQRLTEISIRLEAIQKEQNELLQEANAIIVSELDIAK